MDAGKMEFGHALGNRSILADPRSVNAKATIFKIKFRESFRPFAPSILIETYTIGLSLMQCPICFCFRPKAR